MPHSVTAVIGAMDIEISLLVEQLEKRETKIFTGLRFETGKIKGRDTVIVKCGIGKVNAARCAQAVIDRFAPDAVLHTGIGGGLAPDLHVGDAVVAETLFEHDFDVSPLGYAPGCLCDSARPKEPTAFKTDPKLSLALMRAAQSVLAGRLARCGTIASGDQFIADKTKKDWIRGTFGADVSEMEGGAIAHVCSLAGVPFAVIRSISDCADGSAPENYADFEKETARGSARVILQALSLL